MRGNGRTPCCGSEPTLRVIPMSVLGVKVSYIRYECSNCLTRGDLELEKDRAAISWELDRHTPPTRDDPFTMEAWRAAEVFDTCIGPDRTAAPPAAEKA